MTMVAEMTLLDMRSSIGFPPPSAMRASGARLMFRQAQHEDLFILFQKGGPHPELVEG
jgi:hypothetical protein